MEISKVLAVSAFAGAVGGAAVSAIPCGWFGYIVSLGSHPSAPRDGIRLGFQCVSNGGYVGALASVTIVATSYLAMRCLKKLLS